MSLEDPFFVVKDEVFKALNKTRGLYLRWRELGDSSGAAEIEWTTTELRNSLRSIEWDLEDLEDTIIEKNPNKFRIDNRELASRRHFIDTTRDEVKQMKEKMSLNRNRDRDITAHQPLLDEHNQQHHLHITDDKTHLVECDGVLAGNGSCGQNSLINSGSAVANSIAGTMAAASARHSGTKYSKLENSLDSPGHYGAGDSPEHGFVGEPVSLQQRTMPGHDEPQNIIGDSVGTLKTVSRAINVDLDEQAVMLDDFCTEFDTNESKLDSTMKKVVKVLHMNNDKQQWLVISTLTTLLIIVIALLFLL